MLSGLLPLLHLQGQISLPSLVVSLAQAVIGTAFLWLDEPLGTSGGFRKGKSNDEAPGSHLHLIDDCLDLPFNIQVIVFFQAGAERMFSKCKT